MTARPGQLYLFASVPRELDPGEGHRCYDCSGHDEHGSYGPAMSDAEVLDDGQDHPIDLRDLWFCRRHARERWNVWQRCQAALAGRRKRLRAFRKATQLGFRDLYQLFDVAEQWIRDDCIPEDP